MIARLRARYAAYDWRPVHDGMSGAGVWRLSGPAELYVKTAAAAGLADEEDCDDQRPAARPGGRGAVPARVRGGGRGRHTP